MAVNNDNSYNASIQALNSRFAFIAGKTGDAKVLDGNDLDSIIQNPTTVPNEILALAKELKNHYAQPQSYDYSLDGRFDITEFTDAYANVFALSVDQKRALTKPGDFSNGIVDPFSQGEIGDCWILSGINAVSKSSFGKESISKIIKPNTANNAFGTNGSYTVKFPGDPSGQEFIVTQAEIDERRKAGTASSGDVDTTILEIATIKYYYKDDRASIGQDGIHSAILNLLTGKPAISSGDKPPKEMTDPILRKLAQDQKDGKGFSLEFAGGYASDGTFVASGDPKSLGGHSFALTGIDYDKGIITYENPWDTNVHREMSIDEFETKLSKGGGFDYLN